jgi:hypothetical protein
MIDIGSLVYWSHERLSDSHGQFGIVVDLKPAWHADDRDDTRMINVLFPSTGEEKDFYDWQLKEINEGW